MCDIYTNAHTFTHTYLLKYITELARNKEFTDVK